MDAVGKGGSGSASGPRDANRSGGPPGRSEGLISFVQAPCQYSPMVPPTRNDRISSPISATRMLPSEAKAKEVGHMPAAVAGPPIPG